MLLQPTQVILIPFFYLIINVNRTHATIQENSDFVISVLIFLLLAYSGFAVASIFGWETRGAYVELLGQWGMLVMSFYFGGRTMEKIADKVKVKK